MYIVRFFILIFFIALKILGQTGGANASEYFEQGMLALEKQKDVEAESYFEKSVERYEDASSYYQLALLNLKKNTPVYRAKALRLLKISVWKEPNNITYRTALAELLEDFAKYNAVLQYEKIIEIDENSTNAWLKLGDIKREEFDEYYNSVRKMSEEINSPLDEYALEDFDKAEYFYKKALETDPENTEVILNLALLYERKDTLEGSVHYLKKLVDINPESKEGRLYLGLCYNILGEYKKAHQEFIKAVALMGTEEKNDFTVASVVELINPVFENLAEINNRNYLENIINAYWKINDPLFEETVNERLLEHYSRVAYANLRFAPDNKSIPGWRTDRGKTVLRYGIPKSRIRYRPSIEEFGVMMKTEVWDYEDMTFGFTDQYMSGNFAYSASMGDKSRYASQFAGDSHTYAQQLLNIRYQIYKPPFMGEPFEFDYDIAQFKNPENEKYTDYILSYSFQVQDSSENNNLNKYDHKWSLNYFNNFFEELYLGKGRFFAENDGNNIHEKGISNFIPFKLKPDSGMVAFKIFREYDNGFSSFIRKSKIRNFSGNGLMVSDILFASNINENYKIDDYLRNSLTLIPKAKDFNRQDEVFVYYEIYNLKKEISGLTDFTVQLEIRSEEESGVFRGITSLISSIAESIGLSGDDSIIMTSNYQTKENDPQIYFQLNLTELPPGNYSMKIKVKDNLNNNEETAEKRFSISEDTL